MSPDPVREEAERLVAAAIATVSMAARGLGAGSPLGGFATGDRECCVCPICRVIAAMRDPTPEAAERIATGAGDLASGLASMLRAFSGSSRPAEPAEPADPWRAATTAPPPGRTATPTAAKAPTAAKKPMAKKAVKKAAPREDG